MNGHMKTASVLAAAIGFAIAMQSGPAKAQDKMDMSKMPQVVKDNMERMKKNRLEKCYGINAVSRNDCAEGVHSCAGQATQAHDPKSFVLLPAGVCAKIAGGSLAAK